MANEKKLRKCHKKPSHHGHGRHWGVVIKNWPPQHHRASWVKRYRRLFKAEAKAMAKAQKEQQKKVKGQRKAS